MIERVEAGKRELVAAVPSPRGVPGRPLAEALLGFEASLREARRRMGGWRRPEHEEVWRACRDAIVEALRRAERLRLAAPAVDYEGVVGALSDLLAPLEAFGDAEARIAGRGRGPG